MGIFRFLSLFIFFIASCFARPEVKFSCTPKDLRGERLGPIRNQDSISTCFAFTAADLLTYKLGQRISGIDIALYKRGYFTRMMMDSLGPLKVGGEVPDAFQGSLERGWCLEKDFPSEDNIMGGDYYALFKKIRDYKKLLKMNEAQVCEVKDLLSSVFPKNDRDKLFENFLRSTEDQLLKDLAGDSCKRIKGKDIKLVTKSRNFLFDNINELRDSMDKQLDQNNILGFAYNAKILKNKDAQVQSALAAHTSLIVGRRPNPKTGKCEYLIRNSYGRSCSMYDPRLACEEGYLWMPVDSLKRAMHEVYYVK
ncbi:MAG: hypothetical protein AB7I27_09405 [Bacteriovoracaceae bacterium]